MVVLATIFGSTGPGGWSKDFLQELVNTEILISKTAVKVSFKNLFMMFYLKRLFYF
jgi:hypothetical protein